jgi:hypothetical protein
MVSLHYQIFLFKSVLYGEIIKIEYQSETIDSFAQTEVLLTVHFSIRNTKPIICINFE